jgi:glycosyltransferase involved in cell wall biosynthesis
MMKIMTAMYTLRRGGAYDRFIMMLEAFLERQCEVHCLSLTPIHIKHPCYHNHAVTLPFKHGNDIVTRLVVLFLFPLWLSLIGWREKVDLLVAFGPVYAFMQAIPKLILGRPMITFIRLELSFGLKIQDSPRFLAYLNRVMEYIGLFFSNKVVAANTNIRDRVVQKIGKWKKIEMEVLFNNILPTPDLKSEDIYQTRAQLGISKEAKVLVNVGILNRRKNVEVLLRCLQKIPMQDLFLIVVGEASLNSDFQYKTHLKELTKALGLDKKVIFTGWLKKEELWRVLSAADLLIMPSMREGMPNALLEALAVDLPCIGGNIPGISDILQYEELMFDPLDEKAIAEKIQRTFSDSRFFNKIKELCKERKKVFLFDWKQKVFQMVTDHFPASSGCHKKLR